MSSMAVAVGHKLTILLGVLLRTELWHWLFDVHANYLRDIPSLSPSPFETDTHFPTASKRPSPEKQLRIASSCMNKEGREEGRRDRSCDLVLSSIFREIPFSHKIQLSIYLPSYFASQRGPHEPACQPACLPLPAHRPSRGLAHKFPTGKPFVQVEIN